MSHDTHSILTMLPYPLLNASEQSEAEQIAQLSRRIVPVRKPEPYIRENEVNRSLNHQCLEEIIDIGSLDLQPEETSALVADLNLKHLVGTFFVQNTVSVTPRHRFIALGASVPEVARQAGRFSRTTAGWAWGFNPLPEELHMDFDRLKRPNQEILKRHGLTVHQVHLHPLEGAQYHETTCTTPLKTVVDLIVHHENLALDYLPTTLSDAPYGCTPESIISYIQETPYVRNKDRAVDIVKVVEALSRIR